MGNHRYHKLNVGVNMKNVSNDLILRGCEGEDVVAFQTKVHKIDHISAALKRQAPNISSQINTILNQSDGIMIPSQAFIGGMDCEVLSGNSQGWRKGRLQFKFALEFIPESDEENLMQENSSISSDSSLDSLRTVVD